MWIACLCGGIHGREVCKQREASVDERRAETLLGTGDAGGAPRCGVGAPSMTVATKSENACGFGVEVAEDTESVSPSQKRVPRKKRRESRRD